MALGGKIKKEENNEIQNLESGTTYLIEETT